MPRPDIDACIILKDGADPAWSAGSMLVAAEPPAADLEFEFEFVPELEAHAESDSETEVAVDPEAEAEALPELPLPDADPEPASDPEDPEGDRCRP